MAAGDLLLDVKDVSQKLGGSQILEGVTFQVKDRVRPDKVTGQIAGLLGPSGVGKTRLIRIVAGLDVPDAGSVTRGDGAPIAAGEVGVVFQHYPLLKHRTIRSNLDVAASIGGTTGERATSRIDMLLERFGLAHRQNLYPMQLSGGQRQRAAIAQQIVCHKKLLLLDEPFSGLDPAALDECIKLLVEVAHIDEETTLVIVTHDIKAAMKVSDALFMLGRDRDASGKVTSGAKVQKTYDLVELGLAYREDVEFDPAFTALEREIKAEFKRL
ncbi:MAG: ABC transporter ATP-binding protein [Deltaproteobacteria bacterium]|nr:ABC transporter ATP-binding protein [Deltaproteobacteria bacterium]